MNRRGAICYFAKCILCISNGTRVCIKLLNSNYPHKSHQIEIYDLCCKGVRRPWLQNNDTLGREKRLYPQNLLSSRNMHLCGQKCICRHSATDFSPCRWWTCFFSISHMWFCASLIDEAMVLYECASICLSSLVIVFILILFFKNCYYCFTCMVHSLAKICIPFSYGVKTWLCLSVICSYSSKD